MGLFVDYGDVDDISDRILLPSLVFAIATPLFVIIRFVCQKIYIKYITADDWVILASLVFTQATSVLTILVAQGAFGKHRGDVPAPVIARTYKIYFFAQITYKLTIGLTKVSVLLLYIKVFVRPWFTKSCWTWLGIECAYIISSLFSTIFQCAPVAFAFKKTIPNGSCINLIAFWFASATFNIVSDFVIIVLPVPVIIRLNLPLKKKVALCCVFAIGLVVCIASILRLTTLDIASSAIDPTWTGVGSSMWSVIEANLGIICACLPPLWRPLSIMFSTTSQRVKGLLPEKEASSNQDTVKHHSVRRSRTMLSSSTESAAANIGLRSIDYRLRRDDTWARITHSAEDTHVRCASGGGGDTASDSRGSQDPIVDSPPADDEMGPGSRVIRKTTHVVVQYGNRSDDEDEAPAADGVIDHSRRANKQG